MLLAQLAQPLQKLAQEGVGEHRAQTLRDEHADRPAAAQREGAGGRVGRIAEAVGHLQHPLHGGMAKLLGVVEGERDRRLRHAGGHGDIGDGDASHRAGCLDITWSPRSQLAFTSHWRAGDFAGDHRQGLNRFTKTV